MGITKILKSPLTYAKAEIKHSFKKRAAFKKAYQEAELEEAPKAAKELAKFAARTRLRRAKLKARRPPQTRLHRLELVTKGTKKKVGVDTDAYMRVLGFGSKKKKK